MMAFRSKRFWLPRESAVTLGSDGFPIDPESQVGAHLPARPVPFESISHYSVLGLLGEPGMGKTTIIDALARSTEETGDRVFHRDLGEYSSEAALTDLVEEAKSLSWLGDSKLHIFLDGLDDGLRHFTSFVDVLKRLLRQLSPARVLLRIACRPAEWPSDLERYFKDVFGNIAVYQLIPLRRVDVREAAQAEGVPGDAFLRSVDVVRVAAFAIRPITLEFLLNIYRQGSDLPRRKADLYQQGCWALADESNPSRRRERKLSINQRFAIAGRVAAVNVFCGLNEIWTGPRHSMPDNDLAIDTVFGGEERYGNEVVAVNVETVREALDTGLFSSRGLGRLGFAHQTYAEFLAATYLVNRGVTASEITKLASHPQGSGKVVPQLREVAAWLAALSPDVGRALIANDPETIFISDTPPTNKADIVKLIHEILRRYESGDITDERIIRSTEIDFTDLDVSADLRPYLVNESKPVTVRRVAMSIYQMAKQSRLQTELAKIALNDKEPYEVRAMAICATGRVYDPRLATELSRLVSLDALGDPNDELKGGALIALWPQNLTAEDLFAALVPPKKPGLFGMYKQFLWRDIASELRPVDMSIALSWAGNRVKQIYPEVDELERTVVAIIDVSIDFYTDPAVCETLAEMLLERARSYTIPSSTLAKLNRMPAARRTIGLLALSIEHMDMGRYYSHIDFLGKDDLDFLIDELQGTDSPERRVKLCVIIRQIFNRREPLDPGTLDKLASIARGESIFAPLFKALLSAVELDSSEAVWERSRFATRVEIVQRASGPERSAPLTVEDLLAHSTDKRVFDEACHLLAGESPPWHPADGLVPPGWSSLSRDSQERLAKAAERLLTECPAPDSSWVRSGIRSYSVMYGHWAFRLLLREAPDKFNSLRENVWQEWIFSVFGDTFTNLIPNDDEVAIMKTALRRAPAEFLEALGSIIQGRIEQPGSICILDRLAAVWDRDIADLLRSVLYDQGLPLQSFDPILGCLLDQKDDEATAMSLDWLRTARYSAGGELSRAVTAAIQLLRCKPEVGTDLAWEAIDANSEFARAFFASLTNTVHGDVIAKFVADASEAQLGNLYIRLATAELVEELRGPRGPWAPFRSQKMFESVVIGNLAGRGTPVACHELRRIAIQRPELELKLAIKTAEEIMMRNTWTPPSPDEVLDLWRSGESVVPSQAGTLLSRGGGMLDILVNPEPANGEREVMRPILPTDNHLSRDTLDLSTTVGRQFALDAYTRLWDCREAGLSRTARVDPADLSKWKKDRLPSALRRFPELTHLCSPEMTQGF